MIKYKKRVNLLSFTLAITIYTKHNETKLHMFCTLISFQEVMMNKFRQSIFIFIFLALFSLITATTSLAAPSTVQIFVDGVPLMTDQPAVIRNSRTMVPFNALFSALGATVTWDEPQQKVTGTKGDLKVELFINKTGAKVNGQSVTMDTPVQIINGRTMVPLAFASSYLGSSVAWDGVNYAAYVSTGLSPDIFQPTIPGVDPVVPPAVDPVVPPTVPTVPGITAPAKDTAPKSNVLSGTYVAENLSKQRFAIQFNSSMNADIKGITSGTIGNGTYTVSGSSVTISSDLISGSFNMEELTYNGRKIILLKDTSSTGQKTLAMTPVSYEEFAKAYVSK